MSNRHTFAADVVRRMRASGMAESDTNLAQMVENLLFQHGVIEPHDPDELCFDWILTYTGKQFFPLSPRIEDICIEDIAHGLSNVCRFNGQSRHFISVAQHSVLMSRVCPDKFQALMHDAPESYLVDLPRPVKKRMPFYSKAEAGIWKLVAQKFGLPLELSAAVKEADQRMLLTEKRDIMAKSPIPWAMEELYKPYDEIQILPWAPKFAEKQFLKRFHELYES